MDESLGRAALELGAIMDNVSKSRSCSSFFMWLLDSSSCSDIQALFFETSGQPGTGALDQRESVSRKGEGVSGRASLMCDKA